MDAFTITHDDDGAVRVGWGEPDWLGPIRSQVADGVEASIDVHDDRRWRCSR